MKEKRAKGLPVFPGSISHYIVISVLIILEASTIVAQAYFLAKVITALFERIPISEVLTLIVLFFTFFILRHFFGQLEIKMATSFATKTTENLRNQLFTTYFQQPVSIAQKKGTGHLITLAMEGIDDVRRYLNIIGIRTIKGLVIPAAILLYVFPFDRTSAFILIGTVPIIIIFMILLGLAAEKLADKQYVTYKRLSNHFVDSLKGLDTLMFLGKSKSHAKKISFVSNAYRKATMRTLRIAFLSSFALTFFSSLSIAFVAVGLGFRLIEGTVYLLPALTILILAPEYFAPIKDVGKDYHATLDGQLALSEINELLKERPLVVENSLKSNNGDVQSINVNNITVIIDEKEILKDVSFHVNKGMVGVIGASGSGKSTLIHLLAGRLPYEDGTVNINGKTFSSLHNDWWFDQIAYIPQNPYIFPISLADNIRFYAPDTSDEQVQLMIDRIGLSNIVKTFPDGIDEKIGEGHRSLSGGQEQRIAMARALLSNKPIILLDEPTAHLDVVTEYEIKQLMLDLFQEKFVFIATHRMHWMTEMSDIIVLENGRVVEQGTHKQLLQKNSVYKSLIDWKAGEER